MSVATCARAEDIGAQGRACRIGTSTTSRPAMLTYRGTVYPWHCDHVGHMNVMWYVGKFDEATWQFFNAVGLTPSFLRSARRGMAAVDQRLSYLRELHAGDTVSIATSVCEVQPKRIVLVHEMTNNDTGALAASTVITAVHLDTVARRSCVLPEAVVAAVRALLTVPGAPGAVSPAG